MSRFSPDDLKRFDGTAAYRAICEAIDTEIGISTTRALECWPTETFETGRKQREAITAYLKELSRRTHLPESHPDYIRLASRFHGPHNSPMRLAYRRVLALLPDGLVGNKPFGVFPVEWRSWDLDRLVEQLAIRIPQEGKVCSINVYFYRDISPFNEDSLTTSFSNGLLDHFEPEVDSKGAVFLSRNELRHILESYDFLVSPNILLFMSAIRRRAGPCKSWQSWPALNTPQGEFPQAVCRTQDEDLIRVAYGGALSRELLLLACAPEKNPHKMQTEIW